MLEVIIMDISSHINNYKIQKTVSQDITIKINK